MSQSKSLCRRGVLACLILVLSSSPTWAAGPAWVHLAGGLGQVVWPWLSGLVAAPVSQGHKPRTTAKAGCTIDPQGQTHCEPGITPKSGCSIDPQGRMHCEP